MALTYNCRDTKRPARSRSSKRALTVCPTELPVRPAGALVGGRFAGARLLPRGGGVAAARWRGFARVSRTGSQCWCRCRRRSVAPPGAVDRHALGGAVDDGSPDTGRRGAASSTLPLQGPHPGGLRLRRRRHKLRIPSPRAMSQVENFQLD
ncbi:hypothetical protein MRX96_015898 [Rhipicephalus microplus]